FNVLWAIIKSGNSYLVQMMIVFCLIILTAIALYLFFVMLLRISLRKISTATSFHRILVILLLNLIPILVLYGLYKLMMFRLDSPGGIPPTTQITQEAA